MKGILSDLKAAPLVWGAVCMALTITQTCLCAIITVRTAIELGYHGSDDSLATTATGPALVFSIIMAVFVTFWVVTAALGQRRHQLALLVLQGATPAQLLLRNLVVVAALFIVATLLSCLLTPLLAPLLMKLILAAFDNISVPYTNARLLSALKVGTTTGGVTALIATVLTVRPLAKIRPIEALRLSQVPPARIGLVRAIFGSIVTIGAACFAILPGLKAQRVSDFSAYLSDPSSEGTLAGFIGFGFGVMFLLIFALAAFAPLLLRWFTRLWTQLLPIPSAIWRLARQQAVGRIQRQGMTILPMTAGLALMMSFAGILSTMLLTMQTSASGSSQAKSPSMATIFSTMLAMLAPPLVIALAGALAGLMISARGRSLDLALTYISGGNIGQLRALGSLDGAIMMTTSTLLAFVITLASTSSVAFSLSRLTGSFQVSIQWIAWLIVALLVALSGTIATGLQALTTHFSQSVNVLAQTIGE